MEESGIKAASQHTRRLLRSSSKNSRPLYHLRQLNTTFFGGSTSSSSNFL